MAESTPLPLTPLPLTTDQQFQDVIDRDGALFPAEHPMALQVWPPLPHRLYILTTFPPPPPTLHPQSLRSFFVHHPGFALGYFTPSGTLAAASLAIPLKESSWRKVISGDLEEHDISARDIFAPESDINLAIHWYHISVVDKTAIPAKFYLLASRDLSLAINSLRRDHCPALQVAGFSALAASPAGVEVFRGKLGFRETSLVCRDYVVKTNANGRMSMIQATTDLEAAEQCRQHGLEIVSRMHMLVLDPSDPGLLWDHLRT